MGISANNFVLLELIKDGSIMYTRKLQATEATTFDYTAPATGEYTWRMRSSSIGTTTTQPLTYSLDNLSIFYTYPYTLENCDNLADGYRFGFQGQETETELWNGEASFFKFRISDNRIGRFFSPDLLQTEYPSNSPYAFSENRVIDGSELEGLEYNNMHQEEGVKGVGVSGVGGTPKSDDNFRVGSGDKQFLMQGIYDAKGKFTGTWLASRIVPEQEYKDMYNGTGEGKDEAYVVSNSKYTYFAKNSETFYDKSAQIARYDVAMGGIESSPLKSLIFNGAFNPFRTTQTLEGLEGLRCNINLIKNFSATSAFKDALGKYRGGFTNVGRALTKHTNIVGADDIKMLQTMFGSNSNINAEAARQLKTIMREGIMTTKNTKNYGQVVDYKLNNGIGARFQVETNKFIGFLGR
jgi:hypothetical protein